MLVGNDPHGFKIIPILPLAGGLLELFVRNAKPREFVADTEAKAVAVGKISLVTDGEITRSAGVRIVLNNGRIQIAIGPINAGAGTQGFFFPGLTGPWKRRPSYQSCRPKESSGHASPSVGL